MDLQGLGNNLKMARVYQFDQTKRGVFGIGAVETIAQQAERLGAHTAIIVTDRGIESAGLIDQVRGPLAAGGIDTRVHVTPAGEPSMQLVREAVEAVREDDYELVVGLGGGSSLDTAKITAAMARNPGDPQEYVGGPDKLAKGLPTIMVPTTSGTGSEFSHYSVFHQKADHGYVLKSSWWGDAMFADVALVDPTLTLTCPPKQTAFSGMDALSHIVEGLMSRFSMPLSDALGLEGVRLIARSLPRAYHHGQDLQARWDLSLASSIGGMMIAYDWISGPALLGHVTAEALGPIYGIPHGLACGLVLPYVMDYNLPACVDQLARVAAAMGVDTSDLTPREAAFASVEAVVQLLEDCDMPTTLQELDSVPKEDLPEFAEFLASERQYRGSMPVFNPSQLTVDKAEAFLGRVWEGQFIG
jgi:alcohol dehydrogenase